jgi:ABC-type lipoprotein export system ATPase subunit
METPFLQAEGIHKSYQLGRRRIDVLIDASLSVARGEWLAIIGASGSGKTTFLSILGTLERPDAGRVVCDGAIYGELSASRAAAFRRQRIGFVFQSYHMLPELSVLENVRLPAMLAGVVGSAATGRARALLERVGLGHRLDHKPLELSGGEQQRAAIARALMNDPELILADEPTGNLDSATGGEILDIFGELHDSESRRTMVMVTHDAQVASRADRRIRMVDGRTASADGLGWAGEEGGEGRP